MNTTNLDRAWHRLNPEPCNAPGCECSTEPTLRTALAFYAAVAALFFFFATLLVR